MTTMARATDMAVPQAAGRRDVLRGLYWQEWFAHGSAMLLVLSAWLIGQWVLMLFFHPAWVLGWGIILGAWLGAAFAGADVVEGAEEFSLALPPTRRQRYWVRLSISLSVLVFLVGTSLLAIRFNLPQKLWGLLVESGFTGPFPIPVDKGYTAFFWYGLAMAAPLAAYGVAFGLACLTSTRDQVAGGAMMLGMLFVGAGILIGQTLDGWLWRGRPHDIDSLFSVIILLALAMLYLVLGYVGYQRKDGVVRPRGTYSPEMKAGLASAGILMLLMVLAAVAIRNWPW
jgi:hypothetical protein